MLNGSIIAVFEPFRKKLALLFKPARINIYQFDRGSFSKWRLKKDDILKISLIFKFYC